MAGTVKRDLRKADRAERTRKALEMRKTGATYDVIARTLRLANRGVAFNLVRDAIAAITKEPAEDVLAMELERLDALMVAHWNTAKVDPRSAALVLQILDRRARYLGLDAPQRIETDVNLAAEQHDVLSKSLALLPEAKRAEIIQSLSPTELEALRRSWRFWARDEQLPPTGDWTVWLIWRAAASARREAAPSGR